MTYEFDGIKERLEQLKKASGLTAYKGLKALDKVITLELAENPESANTLLTYRRMCRMQLRTLTR